MSEKNFWNLIRNNLNLKMYRVENRVAVGMPDVHYVSHNSSGWIELKYIPEMAKKGKVKTGVRKAQARWHDSYCKNGGTSWLLFRIERKGIVLVDGSICKTLSKGKTVCNLVEICSWSKMGNMNDNDWDELRSVIDGTETEDDYASIGIGE